MLLQFLAELTDKCIAIEHELQKIFPPTVIELKTKTKYIPFNPASRKQIAERLMLKGWKPELLTEKGNIIVNEDVLAEIKGIPESRIYLLNIFCYRNVLHRLGHGLNFVIQIHSECMVR